jgi:hypothetical protein
MLTLICDCGICLYYLFGVALEMFVYISHWIYILGICFLRDSNIILRDILNDLGYHVIHQYSLRSALEIMSGRQTSLFFFQCAILIPIHVGVYVAFDSTFLK